MDSSIIVQGKADGANPNDRICYICGRAFGTSSISIHEKACISKWEKTQLSLPKSQRLPLPTRPIDSPIKNNKDAAIYNDAAYSAFMEQGRSECPHCQRKFQSDRLVVHLRSCTPGGFFAKRSKNADSTNGHIEKVIQKQPLPMITKNPAQSISSSISKYCSNCGSEFGSSDKFCSSCGNKR